MRSKRKIKKGKLRHSTYKLIDLLKIGKKMLSELENPHLESEIIISSHLDLTKEEFILNLNKGVDYKNVREIISKFEERRKGRPLHYITGKREFLSRKFLVFDGVFIPRFETEEIVYRIIKDEKKYETCLDMCAGTGVIGITLMLEGIVKKCTFVDINPLALENIRANLKKFNLSGEVKRSDMFEKVEGKFDLIFSNPPYIPEDMLEKLNIEVRNEPEESLNGGKDGLKFIKVLLKEGERFLKKPGILVFEYPEFIIESIESLETELNFIEKIPTLSKYIKGAVFAKL